MERAVAIAKLGKILGKSFGYRIDAKAPDQEARDEARAKLKDVSVRREAVRKQKDDRMQKLLREDAEFQRLKTEHAEVSKAYGDLASTGHRYKITVGTTVVGMFFSVKAQGDSWEDVIAQLTGKKVA